MSTQTHAFDRAAVERAVEQRRAEGRAIPSAVQAWDG